MNNKVLEKIRNLVGIIIIFIYSYFCQPLLFKIPILAALNSNLKFVVGLIGAGIIGWIYFTVFNNFFLEK